MILVRLRGGLGNQMFQYAAGLRLAVARGTQLKLDLSLLEAPHRFGARRFYELEPFRTGAEIASAEEIGSFLRRSRSLWSRLRGRPRRLVRERHFHFDPTVLDLPDGVCLHGYWQSPRYFADVEDRVRREFAFEKEPTGRNAELAAEIDACTATSLHVRRGDYVSDPAVQAMHGVCSLDYYRRAIRFVAERVTDPVFVVFSDDPEWTRANLDLGSAGILVDHNGPGRGFEDLRLMSRCRHHIMANSTFSWWGAWLNPSPDKLVVAPDPWFQDEARDTSDLLPEGWVKL
ncbi:MAG: alpha-1,2-fucosyltransferase [Myxococcota bacterium]